MTLLLFCHGPLRAPCPFFLSWPFFFFLYSLPRLTVLSPCLSLSAPPPSSAAWFSLCSSGLPALLPLSLARLLLQQWLPPCPRGTLATSAPGQEPGTACCLRRARGSVWSPLWSGRGCPRVSVSRFRAGLLVRWWAVASEAGDGAGPAVGRAPALKGAA